MTLATLPALGAHQSRALEAIMDRDSLLVEYGTGTGKTRIMVEALQVLVSVGDIPILLCVPNSLMEQTVEEIETWLGKEWRRTNVSILNSKLTMASRAQVLKRAGANVFLLSHEALSYSEIANALRSRRWGAVFVDEASRFRNYSKRTRALRDVGKQAASRYAFTGNLTVRAPTDSWYIMNFLKPGVFGYGNVDMFRTEYCILGGFTGRQALGVRPDKVAQLRGILDEHRITCQLRDIRVMPGRDMFVRKVSMGGKQEAAYEDMKRELRMEIERLGDADFRSEASTYAVRLLRLQEVAAGFGRNAEGDVVRLPSPKTDELISMLNDEPDTPTVVWYWWNPEGDHIKNQLLREDIPFTKFGDKGAVSSFMDGEVNVFVSQIAKGGYGLNLTRATRMVYHSLPWSLDVYLQSQERNVRLTTTADYLEIHHLIVRDTTDEYVRDKLINAAGMSRQLTRSQALDMLK
jgi:hypothetical protein